MMKKEQEEAIIRILANQHQVLEKLCKNRKQINYSVEDVLNDFEHLGVFFKEQNVPRKDLTGPNKEQ